MERGSAVFDQVMEELSAEVGLQGLRPDEDGIYRLGVDDQPVSVGCTDDGTIILCADVGGVPADEREPFYRMLLEARFGDGVNAGAEFSLVPDSDVVLLRRCEPFVGQDASALGDLICAFVDVASEWRRRIAEREFDPSGSKT